VHKICPILVLATIALGGPLRFHPDTIRTGEKYYGSKPFAPESTMVVNTSSSYVTLTLSTISSPLSHSGDQVMFNAAWPKAFAYSADSSINSGSVFRQPLSRASTFGVLGRLDPGRVFNSAEIRLAPHDSTILGVFRFKSCLLLPVRALATTTPVRSCLDEPVNLVFGTTTQGFDTLHVRQNHWSNGLGATAPHFPAPSPKSPTRQFSANGTPSPLNASTVLLAPTGILSHLH